MRSFGVVAVAASCCVACGSSGDDAARGDAMPGEAASEGGFDADVGDAPHDDGPAPPACDGAACIYAAPGGSGTTCSFEAPCTLQNAQAAERGHTGGDVHVFLFAGTYTLTGPLVLDARDSGATGHANVWRAYASDVPVLSGGAVVKSAWKQVDPTHDVWEAAIDPSVRSRQLYVDDRRATRARGFPTTFAKTATGYTTGDATLAAYARPTDLEVFGVATWNAYRCPVESISGTSVTMQQPCWSNTQWHAPWTLDAPSWIENARELLDEEGEFYLDEGRNVVDYKPRAGETMSTVSVVVPVAESLLQIAGALDAPVHDITVTGITFAHATWMQPSSKYGYGDLQAGIFSVDDAVSGFPSKLQKMPGAVSIGPAKSIRVESCVFEHLGAAALSVEVGAQDVTLVGNRVEDISGTGIAVGDVTHGDDANPTDPRKIVSGIVVEDDFVTNVGVEYPDVAGIFLGYVTNARVAHDDLFDLPYTGISLGWGWTTTASVLSTNTIEGNRVSHVLRRLVDGGGIYTLSRDGGSIVMGNYVDDQRAEPSAALYFDNGSAGFDASNNVVERGEYWLYLQIYGAHAIENHVHANFSDTDKLFAGPPDPSNALDGNVVVTGGAWPKGALDVMNAAGLEPAYRSMHPANLALGKSASASSTWSAGGSYPASAANDGDAFDGWSPEPSSTDARPWWQVDLGAPASIARVEVVTRWDYPNDETRRNFEVQASNDPTFATHVVLGKQGNATLPLHAIFVAAASPSIGTTKYRYVRVAKTADEYLFLADVHVLGE